jgi:hypothetical protein
VIFGDPDDVLLHAGHEILAGLTWTDMPAVHVAGVYRIFGTRGECLRAGQSRAHPLLRLMDYRHAAWWPDAVRADYALVSRPLEQVTLLDTRLDAAEEAILRTLGPVFNVRKGKRGWGHSPEARANMRQAR